MTVTGTKEVLKNLTREMVMIPDSLGAALMKEGYALLAEGMEITPVSPGGGTLRRSWYCAPPIDPKSPVVEVGVGTSYALFVHEIPANHRVGQWKYIETPLDRRRSGYVERIGRWAWEFARKGIGVRVLPRSAPTKPSAESKRR